MIQNNSEKITSNLLFTGLAAITLIVIAGPVSDPVNVPKFLFLGIFGAGLLAILVFTKSLFKIPRHILLVILLFNLWGLVAIGFSESPIQQNIYGLIGRNSGYLTYFFFSVFLLITITFENQLSIDKILKVLKITLYVNLVYCLWLVAFKDPIPWVNNYGAFLGTFGNPDFAGAFLGIGGTIILAELIKTQTQIKHKVIYSVLLLITLFGVLETDTTQGILVLFIGIGVVVYFKIRSLARGKFLIYGYLSSAFILSTFTLLGIFQMGPLKTYLYKRSVSLRGVYWESAFKTGKDHILTGVGFDSFGDWYRKERSLKAATWFPGPEVVTNVAHNIYLDIFSYGGIILLICYLFLTLRGFLSIYRLLKFTKKYDFLIAATSGGYVAYVAQSIISISQIGLAIWGWVLLGALIVLEKQKLTKEAATKINTKSRNQIENPNSFVFFIGAIIGLILCLPPYVADAKFTDALNKRDLTKLEQALKPSYFSPSSSERLARAVLILTSSNLPEQALKYARTGVKFNPNYTDGWKLLYYQKNATADEKKVALKNLLRLDPMNKNWKKMK